ncbi:hypothetical protein DCAR_0414762 [Daucus carota subsp. sativus]|uniref:Probable 6-phosphogluconolactonase n=1 Tax=Daucus carota subsp. sativus TaxID=79200 RepID=A0A162A633_DAUCS|nr:PREDICTED: probable 6-phosphogluconolactonase 4, chloroplastic [Daucus carota subsp. sativus]WOG95443.1 hypothetical protein DCAR_0414762 [Daucus carota subsp. sativus]
MAFSSTAFLSTVRTLPAQVPLLRPISLSTPLTSKLFVCKHPISALRSTGVSSLTNHLNPARLVLKRKASMTGVVTDKGKGDIKVFDSEEDLAVSLAKYIANISDKFAKERGAFTVALSGGSLIKSLRKLVDLPHLSSVDWEKWHVFWVDERVVPKDHPDSNYLLACDGLLSKIPLHPGNVYAINDALSAKGAADDYETCLKHLVQNQTLAVSESGFPKFDLILMGMGPDGHVASLFPGHPLVQENKQWVASIENSPKPPPERITFTFPVINASAHIAVVAAGASKAHPVHVAVGDGQNPDLLPVQLVSPEGELAWFLDKEAASKL